MSQHLLFYLFCGLVSSCNYIHKYKIGDQINLETKKEYHLRITLEILTFKLANRNTARGAFCHFKATKAGYPLTNLTTASTPTLFVVPQVKDREYAPDVDCNYGDALHAKIPKNIYIKFLGTRNWWEAGIVRSVARGL